MNFRRPPLSLALSSVFEVYKHEYPGGKRKQTSKKLIIRHDKKKKMSNWIYVLMYTFIYLCNPLLHRVSDTTHLTSIVISFDFKIKHDESVVAVYTHIQYIIPARAFLFFFLSLSMCCCLLLFHCICWPFHRALSSPCPYHIKYPPDSAVYMLEGMPRKGH